jgi:membrane carboxypeptidase/penicillin-binding protein
MKRRVLVSITLPLTVLLVWVCWIAVSSYVRGPRLVAELKRAGALPFAPADLPKARLCALLVVQDPTFYRHQGIGLADGHLGHTTLTQSLGKGLFFDQYSPGLLHLGKIKLMIAAWGFDRSVPKSTQLRMFLNRAYFGIMDGREILGFPSAAMTFFGKSLGALSDQEYFALLAMLEAPNRYHVLRQREASAARVRAIERLILVARGNGCFEGDMPVPCDPTRGRN